MRVISRPDKKVIIQLREFRRPKSGKGNMKHTGSRTITIHDADLIPIYRQLAATLGFIADTDSPDSPKSPK